MLIGVINGVSMKYIEWGIIKKVEFNTQRELSAFRKEIEKTGNFKLIGVTRDVTYPVGYDCYAEAE